MYTISLVLHTSISYIIFFFLLNLYCLWLQCRGFPPKSVHFALFCPIKKAFCFTFCVFLISSTSHDISITWTNFCHRLIYHLTTTTLRLCIRLNEADEQFPNKCVTAFLYLGLLLLDRSWCSRRLARIRSWSLGFLHSFSR